MSLSCRECGCTDDRACEGGCFWALEDVCSRCVLNGLAASAPGLGHEHRRQFAAELLVLAESIDPTISVLEGGASAGYDDDSIDELTYEPRLWRPGDP